MNNVLLTQLRESQDFQQIMDEMVKLRPIIPDYMPQQTRDATENLIERVKYSSAHRAGFDLLYQALTGRAP